MAELGDVTVAYVEPDEVGWTVKLDSQTQSFATASGAIYQGIISARDLAKTGREVWVLWRNGETWSVAWTSSE